MKKQSRIKIFKSFSSYQAALYKTATDKNEIVSYIKDIVIEENRNTDFLISSDVVKRVYDRCVSGKPSGQTIAISLRILQKDIADLIQNTSSKLKESFSSKKESFKPQDVNDAVSETTNVFFGIKESQFFEINKTDRLLKLSIIYYNGFIKSADDEKLATSAISKAVASYLNKLLSLIYKVCLGVGKEKNFLAYASVPAASQTSTSKKDEQGFFSSLKEKIIPKKVSRQTLFKLNPSYRDKKMPEDENWMVFFSEEPGLKNDYDSIKNTLMQWCNYIYLNVNRSALESSYLLDKVAWEITKYNFYVAGTPFIYIPKPYRSKKEVVDFFIDEVAELAQSPSASPPNQNSTSPHSQSGEKTKGPEIDEDAGKKADTTKLPSNSATPVQENKTYPISLSEKWSSRLNAKQKEMLSKLTPEEQKKVEEYLENLGFFEKISIAKMNDDGREAYFKQKVKEQLGDEAYRRVSS